MKTRGYVRPLDGFKPIKMPSNTGTGMILAGLSVALAFALIWYIWWLAALSFAGLLAVAIGHTFNYRREFHVPVETVTRTESERTLLLAAQS